MRPKSWFLAILAMLFMAYPLGGGLISNPIPSAVAGVSENIASLSPSISSDAFAPETSLLPGQAAPDFSLSPSQESPMWNLPHPIDDRSSDDFNPEALPGGLPSPRKDFDIPIVINDRVEQFIEYFQTTLREKFSIWLARSERYIPLLRDLLRSNGLPEDLVYLALIESGFDPHAYSRSKALGLWQFIRSTGRRYGLRVDRWVDERRDPEKSTIAAARYLNDLYGLFECWYLAVASYNAGEGKIAKAVRRYRTEDFWELTKYRYLKKETKDYVPQLIAAALIAKDPEQYGFVGIEYEEPVCYEKVKVPGATDLRLMARACEVSVRELRDLNPELLKGVTPPDVGRYEVKIPCGSKETFLKNFESLEAQGKVHFRIHTVKKGDTLRSIAQSYRTEMTSLVEVNQLTENSRLLPGMDLLVPVAKKTAPEFKSVAKRPSPVRKQARSVRASVPLDRVSLR